jgi:hypothetical protein
VGNRGIAPGASRGVSSRRALCREAHFWRHNSPVWGESMAVTSDGVDAARGPRTVRGLERSGVRSQESGSLGGVSRVPHSPLATRHFLSCTPVYTILRAVVA